MREEGLEKHDISIYVEEKIEYVHSRIALAPLVNGIERAKKLSYLTQKIAQQKIVNLTFLKFQSNNRNFKEKSKDFNTQRIDIYHEHILSESNDHILILFPGIEMIVREEDKMDESSNEELFDKRDFRKKKEKKRSHKPTKEKEEFSKEHFKRMKEEIDELRKNELERSKELEALKVKIEKSEAERTQTAPEYALGFDKNAYLSKGFIESAQWIKNVLAKNMNDKMNEDRQREIFETLIISKKPSSHLGIRACARYNRGEECNLGKWHATHKTSLIGCLNRVNSDP